MKNQRMKRWLEGSRGRAYRVCNKACSRAKRDGLEFDLTTEWVMERMELGCAVTGIPFDVGRDGTTRPFVPSIDRVDNSKGYTQDNCRVVCLIFNYAKCTWTDEDVRRMAEGLLRPSAPPEAARAH